MREALHPVPSPGVGGCARRGWQHYCAFCKTLLLNSSKRGFELGAGRETFGVVFQLRRYFAEEESLFLSTFLFEIPELFSDMPFGK